MSSLINTQFDYKILEDGILPVYETNENKKVVNGRELWRYLGSKQQFADWITLRFSECTAEENVDYEVFQKNMKNLKGGRPTKEYTIKLSTAKEMAMLERNQKGKVVRRYFIDIEEKYKSNIYNSQIPKSLPQALILYAKSLEENEKLEAENTKLLIENEELNETSNNYKIVISSGGLFKIQEVIKMFYLEKIGRNKFFEILRNKKILIPNTKEPYQCYIEKGYFTLKIFTLPNGNLNYTTLVTPKGIDFLLRFCKKNNLINNNFILEVSKNEKVAK